MHNGIAAQPLQKAQRPSGVSYEPKTLNPRNKHASTNALAISAQLPRGLLKLRMSNAGLPLPGTFLSSILLRLLFQIAVLPTQKWVRFIGGGKNKSKNYNNFKTFT